MCRNPRLFRPSHLCGGGVVVDGMARPRRRAIPLWASLASPLSALASGLVWRRWHPISRPARTNRVHRAVRPEAPLTQMVPFRTASAGRRAAIWAPVPRKAELSAVWADEEAAVTTPLWLRRSHRLVLGPPLWVGPQALRATDSTIAGCRVRNRLKPPWAVSALNDGQTIRRSTG